MSEFFLNKSSQPKNPFPVIEAEQADGRRLRSSRSKQRIITAMFELLAEGDMTPSAVDVAARAKVGMRTVFRHFEDMDKIYNEIALKLSEAVMPMITAPYETTAWRDRLFECLEKRAELYEIVFPMKLCLTIRRFQSRFLEEQHQRDISYLRSALQTILPDEILNDRDVFGAIEAALDFSTWRQLRQDQERSVESAKKSIQLTLQGLIRDID